MTDQPKGTKGPLAGKGQTSEDAVFCGTMHRICADGAWLAFVPTWKDNPDEASEAEANAHLIAAAPDMATVLEYYADQFCEGFCKDLPQAGTYQTEMDLDCSGCKARAALAKARGQA